MVTRVLRRASRWAALVVALIVLSPAQAVAQTVEQSRLTPAELATAAQTCSTGIIFSSPQKGRARCSTIPIRAVVRCWDPVRGVGTGSIYGQIAGPGVNSIAVCPRSAPVVSDVGWVAA